MYHYRPSAVACGSQKITKIWLKRKGKHCIFYVYIYWHLMIDEKSTSSKETMAKNGLHKWQYKIKNNFIILLVFFFFVLPQQQRLIHFWSFPPSNNSCCQNVINYRYRAHCRRSRPSAAFLSSDSSSRRPARAALDLIWIWF